jgi:hypothetical protein
VSVVGSAVCLCDEEGSPRIAGMHMVGNGQVIEGSGHCLYCNQTVIGGGDLHDYCKDDYAWELKMKAMNKMWRPA